MPKPITRPPWSVDASERSTDVLVSESHGMTVATFYLRADAEFACRVVNHFAPMLKVLQRIAKLTPGPAGTIGATAIHLARAELARINQEIVE